MSPEHALILKKVSSTSTRCLKRRVGTQLYFHDFRSYLNEAMVSQRAICSYCHQQRVQRQTTAADPSACVNALATSACLCSRQTWLHCACGTQRVALHQLWRTPATLGSSSHMPYHVHTPTCLCTAVICVHAHQVLQSMCRLVRAGLNVSTWQAAPDAAAVC